MTTLRGYLLFASVLALALVLAGCDEALFSSNTDEDIPEIPDGEGTPWVEFVGDDVISGTRGETVTVDIEPGESFGEEITVEYETSGTAVAGVDYEIVGGASPATIPFDPDDNNPDQAEIEVRLLENPAATEVRTLILTLTSASAASGRTVEVGRGGTDIDQSRTIEIAP